MAYSTKRSCPLCDSRKKKRIVDGRFDLAKQIDEINRNGSEAQVNLKDIWGYEGKSAPRFPYARCDECNLVYAETYPNDETLAVLYGGLPDNMDIVDEDARRHTQRDYASRLAKGVPSGGKYLEIGPDTGLFVTQMGVESELSVDRFTGFAYVEPNPATHQALRELPVNGSPIEIHGGLSADDIEGPVSLAILVHVLDHLRTPQTLLEQINRIMMPSGRIMIVTHNQSSAIARAMGRSWPGYHAQHPQLYTKTTLATALERAGFGSIEIHNTKNRIDAGGLATMLAQTVGFSGARTSWLKRFSLTLPLGNILAVGTRNG